MTAARRLVLVVALLWPVAAVAGHPWTPPLITIDAESLRRLGTTGRPLLPVDVRPVEAYRDGRLPGARSIPLSSLTARRGEVPADALVILYGAVGTEEARIAYRYLHSAGHANVVVLEGGFDAWQALGYGVER